MAVFADPTVRVGGVKRHCDVCMIVASERSVELTMVGRQRETITYAQDDLFAGLALLIHHLGMLVDLFDFKLASPDDGLFSPVESSSEVPFDSA